MLSKKFGSVKKLARKAKSFNISKSGPAPRPRPREYLLRDRFEAEASSSPSTTPKGSFAVYVGEDRQRFVVPTGYLSHPLFKMLLEKAYDEFGPNQKSGLVVPCSVATFEEVINAVEAGCNGKFDFGDLVQEFV